MGEGERLAISAYEGEPGRFEGPEPIEATGEGEREADEREEALERELEVLEARERAREERVLVIF
jgi:hypothetical protein